MCGLLLDEILQFIDASNLCVSGRSVNRAFFSLFPKLEDIVGNLIVGFLVVSLFEKLFLEFLQSLVDLISGILLSTADHLCNVLLELRLVGGLITKERVDSLNYHILQYRLIDGSCVAFLPGRFQSTDAAPDDGFAEYSIATDFDRDTLGSTSRHSAPFLCKMGIEKAPSK